MVKRLKSIKLTGFRVALAVTVFTASFYYFFHDDFYLFKAVELKTLDYRFHIRGERTASGKVAIIAIDDYSIENLGKWPWPRSFHADLIDKLTKDGAKVIGFDMIFSEREENPELYNLKILRQYYDSVAPGRGTPANRKFASYMDQALGVADNDILFGQSIERNKNVVVAVAFQGIGVGIEKGKLAKDVEQEGSRDNTESEEPPAELLGQSAALEPEMQSAIYKNVSNASGPDFDAPTAEGRLIPIPELLMPAKALGHVNFRIDVDGSMRWDSMIVEYEGQSFMPISLQMAKIYRGLKDDDIELVQGKGIRFGDIFMPLDAKGRLLVNYYGPTGKIEHYSYSDVVNEALPPGTFKDKIVLVGNMATGLGDVWITPFDQALPGVEKHATVISNILNNEFLARNRKTVLLDVLFIAIIGVILGVVLPRLRSVYGALFSLLALFAASAIAYYAFKLGGVWMNIVYPAFNIFAVSIGVYVYKFFIEEKEKRQITKAFKQYLSPALVEELAKNPASLKLGGQKRELTVLFSDIRGFTSISEAMPPEELVHLINEYFSLMTKTISNNRGIVDKFIGDAIMAVFGAPLFYNEHPESACRAAIEMINALDSKRAEWAGLGYPEIKIGIGINTGPMIVGNMGSDDRFDYTVMGDSVNLASRLEGLCKIYGSKIIVSEFTAMHAKGFSFRELDLVRVKGKEKPIRIFELMGEGADDPARSAELAIYAEGLAHYRERRWAAALGIFSRLKDMADAAQGRQLYEMYGQRCQNYMDNPPDGDWDGVFEFKTK